MSDVSKIKNEFLSFLEKAMGYVPPEAQPAVSAAAADVHSAISEAESAATTTAETAGLALLTNAAPTLESAVTAAVPAEFKPLASLALQLGVAELTARANTPPVVA